MITKQGDAITFYQGENPDIYFDIVDVNDTPYDLTDGEAVLTYKQGSTAVDLDCVIATTQATASFTHAITSAMEGVYKYQLFCRNSAGKLVMTVKGTITVLESLNPDAVSV